MMFKSFIFLCLLFSLVIISSAGVPENTKKDETKLDASHAENQVGSSYRWCSYRGCCGYRGPFGCSKCCSDAEIAEGSKQESYVEESKYGGGGGWGGGGHGGGGHGGGGWGGGGHGGGGGWGGGGHGGGGHGGGGGWGGGGHGGGGHGGGGCRYGCCGHGYGYGYGGGCKCCTAAEAASKKQNENNKP